MIYRSFIVETPQLVRLPGLVHHISLDDIEDFLRELGITKVKATYYRSPGNDYPTHVLIYVNKKPTKKEINELYKSL